MDERLKKLETEHEKGMQLINDGEAQLGRLRVDVIRIEGAIAVLKELIAEQETDTESEDDGSSN